MALGFSPLHRHLLAEACTTYNLLRKVLKSYTALVRRTPVSTLLDLSTALNKHYLEIADTFLHFLSQVLPSCGFIRRQCMSTSISFKISLLSNSLI